MYCIKELEEITTLPIISAIPALDAYLSALSLKKVGVLGTRAVMESKLFGVSSVQVITPPVEKISILHSAYVKLAATGKANFEERAYFQNAARELYDQQGAEAVVLGGTDLSVAFAGAELDFPILDSAIIHVEAIVNASIGNNNKV